MRTLVCTLLLLLVACARRPARSVARAELAPDADVYAALVTSIYTRGVPDTLLIADSTLTFLPSERGDPRWRTQFDSIPPELPPRLEILSRSRRPSAGLVLPRPVVTLGTATLRAIFAAGVSGGWEELHRRYPNQRMYLRFSPAAFSADSLDALVYYESHCGARCGRGAAVWLTRRAGAQWQVRKSVGFWSS